MSKEVRVIVIKIKIVVLEIYVKFMKVYGFFINFIMKVFILFIIKFVVEFNNNVMRYL